jgi:hypothetical protein
LDGITNEFERLLIEEAKIELHSTRNIYIEGIYKKKNSLKESEVGLVGQLPNMIELGSDPFDMKDGFSKSSKKHMKKSGEGWYLTIPFRYANPAALGESSAFMEVMPTAIHNVMRQGINENPEFQLVKSGIPKQYQIPTVRQAVTDYKGDFRETYTSKSTKYEGMVKSDMTSHSSYTTFRRVSDLSDPNSWINTGIEARHLADTAAGKLETDLERFVWGIADEFIGGQ